MSWHYYKLRAAVHFQLKRYDKALANIAKAVELKPDDRSNLLWIPPEQLAKCPDERLRKGLLELADKTIEKTKGSANAYKARAVLHDAFGRREVALADFDKHQLDPKNDACGSGGRLTDIEPGKVGGGWATCPRLSNEARAVDRWYHRPWPDSAEGK